MRIYKIACLACLTMLLLAATAWAATPGEEFVKEQLAQQADLGMRLSEMQAALQAKPEAEWGEAEVRGYLETALWYVFSGVAAYERKLNVTPASLDELAGAECLPSLPLNPCNGWQPMVLRADDPAFHPGDLYIQHYQLTDKEPRHLRACELCVFSPSLSFPPSEIAMSKTNQAWAVIPEGAMFQLGFHRARGGSVE